MTIDLIGEWRIRRRIFGQDARFTGTACISAEGLYSETGVLASPGFSGEAYQRYVYRPSDGGVRILFPDGRIFMNFAFENGHASDRHFCGEDVYEGQFRILRDGRWLAAYKVKGPRKNYTAVSIMSRTDFSTCAD